VPYENRYGKELCGYDVLPTFLFVLNAKLTMERGFDCNICNWKGGLLCNSHQLHLIKNSGPALFSFFFFYGLHRAIKGNWKIKSAKTKCFVRFSIVRIRPKFKKNHQISLYMGQEASQKYRRMFFRKSLSYLACSQIWLNLSYGSSSLWLHHKIREKKHG